LILENILNIKEPANPLPDVKLTDLSDAIQTDLKTLGWDELMPVQAKTIAYMKAGRDMVIQSKTGSGKTGAFLIPLIEILEEAHPYPQALVLVPTRELAVQVEEEVQKLSASRGIRSVAIYGGVKYESQLKALKDGVHIVIATPGRLLDHLKQKNLDFHDLRDLVMDEADEMLSMGFYPDMKKIQSYLPEDYCTTLFSATMPEMVKSLSSEFQSANRGFLSLSYGEISTSNLRHTFVVCDILEKDQTLLRFLEYEKPEYCIVFCNMKRDVNYVGDFLKSRGFEVGVLSGDIPQKQRQSTLTAFREQTLKILIATDVAARGIDISHVTHVFLHDHPDESEVYIHRAGRTARAGRKGMAISIVSQVEELALRKTGKQFDIDFEQIEIPNDEMLAERLKDKVIEGLASARNSIKPKDEKKINFYENVVDKMLEAEKKDLLAYLLWQNQEKP
jgi:ATP-dependent RNA helicase DeaD